MSLSEKTDRQIAATKGYLVQSGIEAGFADTLLSHYADLGREAAATLDTQAAEIERLREKVALAFDEDTKMAALKAQEGVIMQREAEIARLRASLAEARGLVCDALDSRAPDYADIAHPGWYNRARDFITKHGGETPHDPR